MTSPAGSKGKVAFTLIELLIAIAVVGILLAVFFPHRTHRTKRTDPVRCLNNLRQSGIALILYAGDHQDRLPWQIATAEAQLQVNLTASASEHFVRLTKYCRNPSIFICPTDRQRNIAPTNFFAFSNSNLSYFISLDASIQPPLPHGTNFVKFILAGDRHLASGNQPVKPGLFIATNHNAMGWTKELHWTKDRKSTAGVMASLDGHCERVESEKLPAVFAA